MNSDRTVTFTPKPLRFWTDDDKRLLGFTEDQVGVVLAPPTEQERETFQATAPAQPVAWTPKPFDEWTWEDKVMLGWTKDEAPLATLIRNPEPDLLPSPSIWFEPKLGLRADDLARGILKAKPMARAELDDTLHYYDAGVWRPDQHGTVLLGEVTKRLGNRYRPAHVTNVEHILRGCLPAIGCDPIPQAINCTNVLLEWQTGRVFEHTPTLPSTFQIAVAWNPDATCPAVEAWLRQVLPEDLLSWSDDGGPGFIWEVIGYLLYAGNPLQKAILLLGSGRNGKGAFLRLVQALLGPANYSSVDLHSLLSNRFRVANLYGKAANIAGDIDGTMLESTALLKALTGGDTITGERKFGHAFDFTPWAVPVFSANTVFGTPDTSDGYMARWLPIPFPFSFIGREDPSVETAMHAPAELEGVLVKAVEGLRSLMARGRFTEPQSIAEVRARFERESDPIRAFLEACAKRADDPSAYTFTSELYDVYVAYCEDSGVKPQHRKSRPKFIAAVTACGYPVKDRQGKNAFIGLTTTALVNPQAFGSERLIYTEETLG